jgi:hypothetical protein
LCLPCFHFFAAQLDGRKPDRHRPFVAGMLAPASDDVLSIDVVAARHRFMFYGNLPNTRIRGRATATSSAAFFPPLATGGASLPRGAAQLIERRDCPSHVTVTVPTRMPPFRLRLANLEAFKALLA